MGADSRDYVSIEAYERLLAVLAEHIKLPLVQIAHFSELARLTGDTEQYLSPVDTTTAATVQLIDSYLLSRQLSTQQDQVALEPVSIQAVLEDAVHRLSRFADLYNCELQAHVQHISCPVLTHRVALEAALVTLGHAIVESQGMQPAKGKVLITFAAHRTPNGIAAGVFADMDGLSDQLLTRARRMYGTARQPMNEAMSGSAAGVFIADSLLSSMATKLRYASHGRVPGLAATLMPSRQLTLV